MNDKLTYKTVTAAEIHVILFIADAPVRTLFVGSLSQSAVLVPHDTRTRTHTHTSLLRSLSLDLEQDVGVPDFSDGPKVRRIHEVNVLVRLGKVSNLLTKLVRAQLLGAPEQVVPNAVVRRETSRQVVVSKLVQGAHHDQRRPRPAQQIPSQSPRSGGWGAWRGESFILGIGGLLFFQGVRKVVFCPLQ